jgi:hypothetical protein
VIIGTALSAKCRGGRAAGKRSRGFAADVASGDPYAMIFYCRAHRCTHVHQDTPTLSAATRTCLFVLLCFGTFC